jgi:hypothetical protein
MIAILWIPYLTVLIWDWNIIICMCKRFSHTDCGMGVVLNINMKFRTDRLLLIKCPRGTMTQYQYHRQLIVPVLHQYHAQLFVPPDVSTMANRLYHQWTSVIVLEDGKPFIYPLSPTFSAIYVGENICERIKSAVYWKSICWDKHMHAVHMFTTLLVYTTNTFIAP